MKSFLLNFIYCYYVSQLNGKEEKQKRIDKIRERCTLYTVHIHISIGLWLRWIKWMNEIGMKFNETNCQPIRYRLKFHIHQILKPFCPLSQSMLNAERWTPERRTQSNSKKKTFLLNAFRISLIISKWQMEFVTCQKMTTKENCSAFYFVRTINDKWEFGLNWKRIWNYVWKKYESVFLWQKGKENKREKQSQVNWTIERFHDSIEMTKQKQK